MVTFVKYEKQQPKEENRRRLWYKNEVRQFSRFVRLSVYLNPTGTVSYAYNEKLVCIPFM